MKFIAYLIIFLASLACLAAVGPQPTEVMLLQFADHPEEPCTAAYAGDLVFNKYNTWLQNESHGKEWLTGDAANNVWGWITLPHDSSYYCQIGGANPSQCNTQIILADAYPLMDARFDRTLTKFVILYVTAFGGGAGGGGYIFGDCSFTLGPAMAILIHEGGHAHQLWHAATWSCPSRDVGEDYVHLLNGGCLAGHYGDTYDPMGNVSNDLVVQATQHYSTWNRDQLGWQQAGNIQVVSTAALATLTRADISTYAVQEIRIPLSTDGRYLYTLEYRNGIGALIRLVQNPPTDFSAKTYLVNGVYPDPWNHPTAITLTNPFYDPYRSIYVQMISSDTTSANLAISFSEPSVNPPPPHGRKKKEIR